MLIQQTRENLNNTYQNYPAQNLKDKKRVGHIICYFIYMPAICGDYYAAKTCILYQSNNICESSPRD